MTAPRDEGIREPPTTLRGTLGALGPGLIVASLLVGSGELIATTKVGAQAGITLLWLIVLGCVMKVFVQVELGRYTVSRGETTLAALDSVPGPRARVGWIVWLWFIVNLGGVALQGAIIGGVGQTLAMTVPIRGDYLQAIQSPAAVAAVTTYDDKIWAVLGALLTAAVLYRGRYRLIQTISIVMVAVFTVVSLGNVIALQMTPEWRVPLGDLVRGMSLGVPSETIGGVDPWLAALAAFGIIGVGVGELVIYPYWCLEKGYARHVGPRSDDAGWLARARGWLRVLRIDAFSSMVLYTLVTLAFFLMGVAVLHRQGLDPDGMRMVSTLAEAYAPVFGAQARWLFLLGAIAVLASTFLGANASYARLYTDFLKVGRWLPRDDPARHDRSVSAFSVALPLVSVCFFLSGANPVALILIGGLLNGVLLPVVGFSAVYFRHTRTDPRLCPGRAWDAALLLSCIGALVVGVYGVWVSLDSIVEFLNQLF